MGQAVVANLRVGKFKCTFLTQMGFHRADWDCGAFRKLGVPLSVGEVQPKWHSDLKGSQAR